ncbi:MAG: DNA mismatch repair endonuclease MutL [Candidatus Gracilibacteria bacterium]|jgi:DNA mismatch repair protein MutL
MSKIQVLPDFLINQIAAGEVVERPASVVKELVENSLDAGATSVTVEVDGGGDTLLRITDNGYGMDQDDALLAFERHATSKISTQDDLVNIHTLGFRGEALASIASVSSMTLQTKKKGAMEGTIVICEGGEMKKLKPAGMPEGTQIEIKQLFFNTPARKKYLKNTVTEYNHIFNTITGLALAFPQVAFKLIHDEKIVLDLPATEDHFSRIRNLMGRTIADELIPVFYGHSQLHLEGFIGKPLIARANRNAQYLFVNNREVKSHVLSYSVKESYYSLLPKEKYPVFFLFYHLDPELVDVNVHPRKSEVRFRDEREIFRITSQACHKSLETHILAPQINSNGPVNYYQERSPQPLKMMDSGNSVVGSGNGLGLRSPQLVQVALDFTKDFSAGLNNKTGFQNGTGVLQNDNAQENLPGSEMRKGAVNEQNSTVGEHNELERAHSEELIPLGQLALSYILCQQGKALVIVDQHAAHERIRYTEILEDFAKQIRASQPLLTPLTFELSQKECAIIQENNEILEGLGFEIEPFGGNTFVLHSVPNFMVQEDIQKTLLGLIDDLGSQSQKGDFLKRKEKSLIYMACRSARKFGDVLSASEQKELVKKLMTLAFPYTCPHGRPTMVIMSEGELLKRFGRDYS